MLTIDGGQVALELKHLTAAWSGYVSDEQFNLLAQAAQDIRAYDCIKDIQRVEGLGSTVPERRGLGPRAIQRSYVLAPRRAWPSNQRRRCSPP